MLFGKRKSSPSIRTKFTFVFGFMFLISTVLPLTLTLLFTFQSLKQSNHSEIADKAAELQLEYQFGGLKKVVNSVELDNTLHFDRPYYIRISEINSNRTIFASTPRSWDGFNFSQLSNHQVPEDGQFITLSQLGVEYAIEIITRQLSDRYILQVGSSNKMRNHVINSSINTFLLVIIPSTTIVLLLVWFISSSMLKPISNVVKVVEQVNRTGKYDHRIPISRNSRELDELVYLINQMFAKLARLINNLKETLETVAHDIRTPMTRIRTRAEVAIQQSEDTEEMQRTLYTIVNESETISSLLRLILDAAEAESGIVKIEEKEIDLVAVCRDAVEVYDYVADAKSVEVRLNSPESMLIHADPSRIQQAIGNLLDNAVKYTDDGTVVEVEVKTNASAVVIYVRDRGPGIHASKWTDIWAPRYRLSRTKQSGGYGLGLTIVKAVAEAHNGTVEIRNRTSGGAEFVFSLPAGRIMH